MNIKELEGKKIKKIIKSNYDTELLFICDDGSQYKMYHEEDGNESVWLEDVGGDLEDLIDAEVISAEVRDSGQDVLFDFENKTEERKQLNEKLKQKGERLQDHVLFTVYLIQTNKGSVKLKWVGMNNGEYSLEVDFIKIKEAN